MSGHLFDVRLELALPEFKLDYRLVTDARCVGVLGASGAGKTTVLECVAGWRRPTSGHVRVAGRTLFDSSAGVDRPARERGIGYVPQDTLLFPHWDVRANVTAGAARSGSASGVALVERVLAFLELAPLAARDVGELSGGERHRVALARALCAEPRLLLFDEPLASLDPPLKRRILADLARVREEFDVPMLLVSHDATDVHVLCDHAQRLAHGRVEAEGAPDQVLHTAPGAGHTDYANVLRGAVTQAHGDVARVDLGGEVELVVPGGELAPGDRVVLGLRPDDVLLATAKPTGLSARNVLAASVTEVTHRADSQAVRVTLGRGAPELDVHVTAGAARELGLAPGAAVFVIVKTRSIETLARLPGERG